MAALKNKNTFIGKTLIYAGLTLFSAVIMVPFFYLITTSFKNLDEVTSATYTILPQSSNFFTNLKEVFAEPKYHFFRVFFNTMIVFAVKTLGALVTCAVSAYGFARFKCKLNKWVFMMFIAVLFLPGELMGIPFYEAMIGLNLRYSSIYLPLWLGAWFGIDITIIFLFRQFFVSLPASLVDAARIDGCNEFTAFLRIAFPLSKSVIITTVILYFVGTYNDIYNPTLYIKANDFPRFMVAQTIGIFESKYNTGSREYIVPWQLVSAATLISIFPVLAFFSLAQKYFVESFVGSGLKG